MLIDRETVASEPLLSPSEERELARQIEAGVLAREVRLSGRQFHDATGLELVTLEDLGERARQRFIRANLRLVAKAARQAARRSQLPETDLFQEGCLGLICAVERFDHQLGYKFSTYASWWIRAYLGAATANLFGALNLPTSRANQLRLVRGVVVELAQSYGRSASVAEVAAALGRSQQWTAAMLAHQPPQSLDGLRAYGFDLSDSAGGSDGELLDSDRPGVELLWHLPDLDRQVLGLRYGFGDGTAHTYAEIAQLLGLTVSRVRRLERRALEVLRTVCPRSAHLHL
ncbi:MAG: sigma-70 family RNA polymerase sigma factor [Propionibacteriaceae bacterium]|nr:sigma-70 family RNA polymerase sigma factor [Propionibacteriaceae bacterium]